MPTIASSVVPPPKSWDEFEDIALAAAKLRWDSSDFERHGRAGQKQDGVDIYGHDDDDRHIGVQCKNTVGGLTLKTIKDEIDQAEKFEPALDKLYIATTAKRDALLQKEVRSLSKERRAAKNFSVNILFWDDICQDLAKDDEAFFAHYPQFRGKVDEARAHDRALYDSLTLLLSSKGVIGFIDQNNMAGFSYPQAKFEPMWEFFYEWNAPEREFISPELEALRKELWKKVDAYTSLLANQTFATNNPERHSVPPEWEYEQPERFDRVVKEFHSLARDIVSIHGAIVRTGKAQLVAGG